MRFCLFGPRGSYRLWACRAEWRLALTAFLLTLLLCSCSSFTGRSAGLERSRAAASLSDDEIDAALQRSANTALGTRDGVVIVMDPRSGRVRAIVNPRQAFQQAFPPGSTIKPFTTLAALRARLIDSNSRGYCHERYKRGDFETHCSHVRFKPPFNPVQALAYSCNYYFAKVGERLGEGVFNQVLGEFGLGARTGSDDSEESPGQIPHNAWSVQNALGEGGQILVTPAQLITAYAALVNGGRLYVPHSGPALSFVPHSRSDVELDAGHRELLLQGMKGAIKYGTASRAGFDSIPLNILGKTGTACPVDDVHSQGWFVGFATDPGSPLAFDPEQLRLAVLVFVKHARGAECANMSRAIFNEFSRALAGGTLTDAVRESVSAIGEGQLSPSSQVRVHLLREGITKTLSLDDYVFGVLAAEGSLESEYEAIKAQAIVVRTFALRNLARHKREGYDFCSNTHCQRYMTVDDEGTRPGFYEMLHRAIRETTGETLREGTRTIVNAYFSADCGGMTANIQSLWGGPPFGYLRGVRDDYCAGSQYTTWTDKIPSSRLVKALQEDPRSNVGNHLDDLRVVKRDASGRAEIIELKGERSLILRGWDFKIIVGRALGWDLLKSTRFEVKRVGADFIFRGSGFGHGLGLCQNGAHVMAVRGAAYRQILDHYFPGTTVYKIGLYENESSLQ